MTTSASRREVKIKGEGFRHGYVRMMAQICSSTPDVAAEPVVSSVPPPFDSACGSHERRTMRREDDFTGLGELEARRAVDGCRPHQPCRAVWPLVLAIGATLTAQVLSVFEAILEQMTVLALFVPLLIGTGGNTGNQAATTVTRALALNDVQPCDALRVLTREMRVRIMLGLLLGSIGFAITSLVYDSHVGLVIGLTLPGALS
jgi:hypothetical protein